MFQIVSPNLSDYSELINHSLLQTVEPGVFALHRLIKRFAAEKLDAKHPAHQHFSAVFLNKIILGDDGLEIQGKVEPETVKSLRVSFENIVTAWHQGIRLGLWSLLAESTPGYYLLVDLTGNFALGQEGFAELYRAVEQHVDSVDQADQMLGLSANYLSLLHGRLRDPNAAILWGEKAVKHLEKIEPTKDLAHAYGTLGNFILFYGDENQIQTDGLRLLQKGAELGQHFEIPQLEFDSFASQAMYVGRQGKWGELANLEEQGRDLVNQNENLNSKLLTQVQFTLDDWDLATKNNENQAELAERNGWQMEVKNWIAINRSIIQTYAGDIDGSLETLELIYTNISLDAAEHAAYAALLFTLAGERGNFEEWRNRVIQLNKTQGLYGILHARVIILVGAAEFIWGETSQAETRFEEVLKIGLNVPDIATSFTSTYFLTLIRADYLPAEFVVEMLKSGATAYAMYPVLRRWAIDRLQSTGLSVSEKEKSRYAMLDLEAVRQLAIQLQESKTAL